MPSDPSKSKILFLDRDGVINVDSGHPWRITDIQFCDGIFDFVRRANAAKFIVVVVTNQAGIAKGMYTEEDFKLLTQWMNGQFQLANAVIDSVEYCPHHPDGIIDRYRIQCECRKPQPGMICGALKAYSGDAARSILVGDRATDIEAAVSSNIGTAYKLVSGGAVTKRDSKSNTTIVEVNSFVEIDF